MNVRTKPYTASSTTSPIEISDKTDATTQGNKEEKIRFSENFGARHFMISNDGADTRLRIKIITDDGAAFETEEEAEAHEGRSELFKYQLSQNAKWFQDLTMALLQDWDAVARLPTQRPDMRTTMSTKAHTTFNASANLTTKGDGFEIIHTNFKPLTAKEQLDLAAAAKPFNVDAPELDDPLLSSPLTNSALSSKGSFMSAVKGSCKPTMPSLYNPASSVSSPFTITNAQSSFADLAGMSTPFPQ